MKLQASPALVESLRLYAGPFAKELPEPHAFFPEGPEPVFPFPPQSDRGLGILLFCAALYRPGGEAETARLVAGLYRRFGNDIFRLNRIGFEELQKEVEVLCPRLDPEERKRIPGILRSVCDFFYRVGPLGRWLSSSPDWEIRAGELCGEIYRMGLRSPTRTKARYFFWMICQPPGAAEAHIQALDFVWPVGPGHMRFSIDVLKAFRPAAVGGEAWLQAFADFGRLVFPGEPWRLFRPLDSYLRRGGHLQYRCRTIHGGCRRCPLADHCPASRHFLVAET